ncbi:hypothetical protein AX16_009169 [Volvariella volvacea WC 439]|nr:hypothetical protein AX16_009169 [Volvariella volvacea WC 439]
MSTPSLPTEQLLELLIHLKRTTPTAAKDILNAQPQIAYALMSLMVNMNAVNVEVCQRILSDYSASTAPLPSTMDAAGPPPIAAPVPAIPPHLQPSSYRNATPPTSGTPPAHPTPPQGYPTPPYTNGQYPPAPAGYPAPQHGYNYGQPPTGYPSYPPSYPPPQQPAPSVTPSPEILASIPQDQRELLMRVISMSSEEINRLPPSERSTYIQLVRSFYLISMTSLTQMVIAESTFGYTYRLIVIPIPKVFSSASL